MSTQGPDPRASARGLIALALDQARIDPNRRPSADMRQWLADFAAVIGEPRSAPPSTNRDLVATALRLEQIAHARSEEVTAPPDRTVVTRTR